MINTEQIQNDKLRTFLENHPDAKLEDVIEFCKQQFLEEFMPSVRNQIDLSIDKNRYRTRILDEIAPYERETEAYREYYHLADIASQRYDQIMFQVINLVDNHDKDFAQALRGAFEQEMAEIGMTKPSEYFEASRNSIMGNAMKEAQDLEDRKTSAELTEASKSAKETVFEEFKRLLSDDLRKYGMNFSGRWGNFSLEIDPSHQRGAQTKLDEFAMILRESKDLFSQEFPAVLLRRNNRIFEEFQEVRSKFIKIIEEAVRVFAREEKEADDKLPDESEQSEIIIEHTSEDIHEKTNTYWLGDMEAFSKPWMRPSEENMKVYKAKGISEEDAIAFVWDRFIRTTRINDAFEAGKISEDEKKRQLALVERTEELLFDGLMQGKHVEDIRFSSEIGAAKESDFGILGMDSKDFWKSENAEIFNKVGIYPEEETIEELKSKGIKEEDIPVLIWDGFCRRSRISIAFENGRITEEERDTQIELVRKVEEIITNELLAGKTIEEARQLAETQVVQELEHLVVPKSDLANTLDSFEQIVLEYIAQGKDVKEAMDLAKQEILSREVVTPEVQVASRKPGLEDVTSDPNVKFSDVKDAILAITSERQIQDSDINRSEENDENQSR